MYVAVVGCLHGEFTSLYESIAELERAESVNIELVLVCGDVQTVRNADDLECMAVPQKYKRAGEFADYYNGTKVAPKLTIFIGGNHEASNVLQELPLGGFVAPNIYFLGYSGVVNVNGIRIAGISGIYKSHDYHKPRFEHPPYSTSTIRSIYHTRSCDVERLLAIKGSNGSHPPLDIFLSHDWPTLATRYGNIDQLLVRKPMFRDEVRRGELGSPVLNQLVTELRPAYWFSAHLHVKYSAIIPHDQAKQRTGSNGSETTRFLALDKAQPRRHFLQLLSIESSRNSLENEQLYLELDLPWLTTLHRLMNPSASESDVLNLLGGPESLKLTSKSGLDRAESPSQQINQSFGSRPTMPTSLKQNSHTSQLISKLQLESIFPFNSSTRNPLQHEPKKPKLDSTQADCQ
mmetsp:Transcript_13615/g.24422  ORF Transcript_13615/g.24422 Transcript_13615/m.24422 type:complete len:404 (+) Transcript_13615:91-1302(+)